MYVCVCVCLLIHSVPTYTQCVRSTFNRKATTRTVMYGVCNSGQSYQGTNGGKSADGMAMHSVHVKFRLTLCAHVWCLWRLPTLYDHCQHCVPFVKFRSTLCAHVWCLCIHVWCLCFQMYDVYTFKCRKWRIGNGGNVGTSCMIFMHSNVENKMGLMWLRLTGLRYCN